MIPGKKRWPTSKHIEDSSLLGKAAKNSSSPFNLKQVIPIALVGLVFLGMRANAALIGFNAEDGSSATTTVSVTLGTDFTPPITNSSALDGKYITIASNGGGGSPGLVERVATYTIEFPEAGTYDLYARVWVGPFTGSDDSMFYGNGFGIKSEFTDTDWITCNGIFDTLNPLGEAPEKWAWIDLSKNAGQFGGTPVTFQVDAAGTQTFQIGGREDGFFIDAFAFGASTDAYSRVELNAAVSTNASDFSYASTPGNGAIQVSRRTPVSVMVTDEGVHLASIIQSYELLINSNIVSGVTTNFIETTFTNGVVVGGGTMFSYVPPVDFNPNTVENVQLNIYRTDNKTNSFSFSFTTIEANAVKVLVSGTSAANDQPIVNFLTNNFQNVVLNYADYSGYFAHQAEIESADLFVVGRSLSSGAYGNATNSAAFNALNIPVVSFTSYVTRAPGGRWGWHNGDVVFGASTSANETTVTAAGATTFGVAAGSYDWFADSGGFSAAGGGSVGAGEILATIGGDIVAAHWNAGALSGAGVAFGGERLLFNASQSGSTTVLPSTGMGQLALLKALGAYTPLVAKDPVALTPTISPAATTYTGDTAILSASALSSGPLTYQWQWDQGLGGSFSDIVGATSQIYTQDTASLLGNYQYQVIVRNANSDVTTSPVAVLTVNPAQAPALTTDTTPLSATAYVGDQVTFAAAFDGNHPITNQWQFSTDGGTWIDRPGATNATLTATNLKLSDTGYYRLQAANFLGANWSSPAYLTVLAMPPSSGNAAADLLAMDPIAYWPLNDATYPGSGDAPVYDASGKNHTGVYTLNALNGTSGIVGPQAADGYPRFADGQGALQVSPDLNPSYATTPALNLNTNTVSINAWVWPDGIQSNFAGIFFNGNSDSLGGLTVGNTNELRYTWVSNTTNQWGHDTGLVLPTNQWSFVALVVKPDSTTWYLYNTNGLLTHSLAISNSVTSWGGSASNIRIGSDSRDATRTWRGKIDEVAVFDRALNQAQVMQLATGVPAPQIPALTISTAGNNVVVSWSNGRLLEANNVTGPWTTNSAAISPYTNVPAGAQKFFKAVAP